MLRLVLIASVASLIAGASVAAPEYGFQATSAPEPTTNSSTTADTSATDPDKVICRNVKPPTGTRIGSARNRQRICQTKADWDQQELQAQEAARTARGNGAYSAPNENGPG